MKKVIAVVLAIALAAGALAGCGKPAKEAVELFINVPVLTADCVAHP